MQISHHYIEEYRNLQQEIIGTLIDFSVAEKELYDLVVMLNAVSRHYKTKGSTNDPNIKKYGK